MKTFEEIFDYVNGLDPNMHNFELAKLASILVPEIDKYDGPDRHGREIFMHFLISVMFSDGKYNDEEFTLFAPTLMAIFGSGVDVYAIRDDLRTFKRSKRDEEICDEMVDMLGTFDEKVKEDIIICAVLICVANDKVTNKELKFIKRLYD